MPSDEKQPLLTDRALAEDLPQWGVLVLESHHSPEFSMEYRSHAFLKLVYVIRGAGVMELFDRVVHFQEGDLIVVQPQTINRIVDAPDAASSLYVCCIAPELFAFEPTLVSRVQDGLVASDAHFSNRVGNQLRRMRHAQSNGGQDAPLAMVASALRLVQWILHQAPRASDRAVPSGNEQQRVREYVHTLDTEFFEATTIDEAAHRLGMSRRSFTKWFHEITGKTWLTYIRRLMIRHARHQLLQTNLSIATIAFESGFNDLSTFYRQFKSQVGMSPKAYRRSNGENDEVPPTHPNTSD
ncbi:MAG: AraC family transcriptional regulator [Planctomycetota bacterium]